MTLGAQRWLRFLALTGVLVTTAYLLSYFVTRRAPSRPPDVARRDLTPDIEVVSNDFQYLHKEGDITRLILRAKRDTAFVNGQHKLEGVELQTFDAQGQPTGKLTAETCDYDPTARTSDFRGNVVLTTTQGLTVKTESIRYDREAEAATTSDPVQFVRGRVSGEARGRSSMARPTGWCWKRTCARPLPLKSQPSPRPSSLPVGLNIWPAKNASCLARGRG